HPSYILTTTKYDILNKKTTKISTSNDNCGKLVHDEMLSKDTDDMLVENNSDTDILYEDDMLGKDDMVGEGNILSDDDILSDDEDDMLSGNNMLSEDYILSENDWLSENDVLSKDDVLSNNILSKDDILSNDVLSEDNSDREIVDEPLNNENIPHINGEFAPYFSNITEALMFSTQAYDDLANIICHPQFKCEDIIKNIRWFREYRQRLHLLPIRSHQIRISSRQTPSTSKNIKKAYYLSV
ncbi:15164_t:CDS:2, partial [Racocetra fulgida]